MKIIKVEKEDESRCRTRWLRRKKDIEVGWVYISALSMNHRPASDSWNSNGKGVLHAQAHV